MRGVSHCYRTRGRDIAAVRGVSLMVAARETVCLLGPSGCGKSTILRLIAGLERPWEGEIFMAGVRAAGGGDFVPPEARGIGFVFQDHTLFPHLTVADNIAFGLRGLPAGQRQARVAGLLDQLRLGGRGEAWPHMLSGGERQRVALARALAPEPRLVLMDEPFSDLDRPLRFALQKETRAFMARSGAACLFVTHDHEEALHMAGRIALMREGSVIQTGAPEALYFDPVNATAAALFGEANLVPAVVTDGIAVAGALSADAPKTLAEGAAVTLLIRPEAFFPLPSSAAGGFVVTVREVLFLGIDSLVTFVAPGVGGLLTARLRGRRLARPVPSQMRFGFDPALVRVLPGEGDDAGER